MSSKRIDQAIEEIYDFVESCKHKKLQPSIIILNKDDLYERLDELKLKVPEEIQRCTKILERREEILADAEMKAQKIIEDAQLKADMMVQDSEIMRQAYLQANEFIARANQHADETMFQANYEAEQIRTGAYDYTKDMLTQIQTLFENALEETRAKSTALVDTLARNLEIVTANRKELCEEVAPQPAPVNIEGLDDPQEDGEDIDVLGSNPAEYGRYDQ